MESIKTMIEATNISKDYGSLSVLSNINLAIKANEIVAIVGPSGAGKTTLLQILGTLDRPKTSENAVLRINEVDVTQLSDKALAKFRNQHLGFVFQFHELLPEFTALENVCMPAWIAKEDQAVVKTKAIRLLDLLGLNDRIDHKPMALSGGEQQRVAVARALINQPKVIFADEPSGNLDSENAKRLHDLFFKLRDEMGCSFVIVTHNEKLARRADRIIALKDGAIKQ